MAYVIPLILAQGIYTGIITGISGIVLGTVRTIKAIYTHQNPDVNKIVRKLDLERRLILIQSVLRAINNQAKDKKLNELEKKDLHQSISLETDLDNDPIELCLLFLQQTINDINNDLEAINKKVAYHNTKWFSSWRKLNIKSLLVSLEEHSVQLNSRFDDLTKVSTFLKNR